MADLRKGKDTVVFRPKGKSHKKVGSAPKSCLSVYWAKGRRRSSVVGFHEKTKVESSSRGCELTPRLVRPRPSWPGILIRLHAFQKGKEVSAPNIDDKALEEGSAAKRHCKTGERSSVIKSPPGNSALIQGGDLVGFDRQKERLIQLLLEGNSAKKKVVVTGRRGSGKTTLVKKVCEDVRVRDHFGAITWISIPRVYDPLSIGREILAQFLFEKKVPVPESINDLMSEEVINLLQEARHLVVVDNSYDYATRDYDKELTFIVKTSQVILIARRDMLIERIPINQYGCKLEVYGLEDLSEKESWELFCLKTFPEGDVPSPLKEVCQDIVRKFDGLPEAIVLVSRLLCNKKERTNGWESMIASFDLSHVLDLIQNVLQIIYGTEDYASCLLYLSLFPENSLISCNRISRLWAAEGFIGPWHDDDLRGGWYFLQDLLNRKCIHPVEKRSDGRLSTFRVDNFVHEIIVSFSNHLDILRMTGECSINWPERVRYLSVRGPFKDLNEEKLSQLCSLFVFDIPTNKDKTTMFEETSENPLFPFKLKLLKVLDLTGAPLQISPDAFLELTLLRYLNFKDTSIKEISGSIRKLMHLEYLVIKHSLVTELPKEVEGLKRIRHILLYHHEKDPLMESYDLIGFRALCSFEGFECLEKLCFVEADDSILEDLEKLTKLRRLGITQLREEHGKLFCSSLEKLGELESLNIHAFDEEEIIDLHHLSSLPKNLKRLYLHGRLEKLPNQISSLQYLTKIILRWSHLKEDLLATLGVLPNLVELELRRAYDGRQLSFKKGQFPELKILLLDELEGLISMSLQKGTMPCLEDLTISRCHWLEGIPSGIENIRPKKLTFFDMSREFYEKIRAKHEEDGYKKFTHIKEFYFRRWRGGHWESTDEAHRFHQAKSINEAHEEKALMKPVVPIRPPFTTMK